MICFKVTINGESTCIAGIDESGVLSAILTMVRNPAQISEDDAVCSELDFSVGGLKHNENNPDLYVDWVKKNLSIGDEVIIEVIDVPQSDEPLRTREKD